MRQIDPRESVGLRVIACDVAPSGQLVIVFEGEAFAALPLQGGVTVEPHVFGDPISGVPRVTRETLAALGVATEKQIDDTITEKQIERAAKEESDDRALLAQLKAKYEAGNEEVRTR